jgi:drug/metabolite transporter (DMT)-like permease
MCRQPWHGEDRRGWRMLAASVARRPDLCRHRRLEKAVADVVAWIVVVLLLVASVGLFFYRNVRLFLAALPFRLRRVAQFAAFLWRRRHARPDERPDPRAELDRRAKLDRAAKREAWDLFALVGGLFASFTAIGQVLGNGNLWLALASAVVALGLLGWRERTRWREWTPTLEPGEWTGPLLALLLAFRGMRLLVSLVDRAVTSRWRRHHPKR